MLEGLLKKINKREIKNNKMTHGIGGRKGKTAEQRKRDAERVTAGLKEQEKRRATATQPATTPEQTPPKVFRTPEGRLSGVDVRGKTFLGLSPDEVREISAREQGRRETPAGAEEFGLTQKQKDVLALKERIRADPEQFGLNLQEAESLGEQFQPTQGGQLQQQQQISQPQPRGELSNFDKLMNLAFGNFLEIDPLTGEKRIDPSTGQPIRVVGEPVIVGGGGGGFWKIGKRIFTNPILAVKTGKALQITKSVGNFIKNNKILSAALGIGGALVSKEALEGKIDERQQALNTAGQEASTIVGSVRTGYIDPNVGLRELDRLEQFIIAEEKSSKEAKISSFVARLSGKLIDFDADVKDALDTIVEGRGDIFEFKATGQVPELTPFELNILLRELEDEGIIEKVEFAPFREELEAKAK